MNDNNLPPTIKHPEAFKNSPAAGFDGTFDWSWTEGCFGKTKITPMDFDGVVERKGNFIVFETKDKGLTVPQGQLITLGRFWERGGVTVLFVYGKMKLERCIYVLPRKSNRPSPISGELIGVEKAQDFVKKWYAHADNNPFTPIIK